MPHRRSPARPAAPAAHARRGRPCRPSRLGPVFARQPLRPAQRLKLLGREVRERERLALGTLRAGFSRVALLTLGTRCAVLAVGAVFSRCAILARQAVGTCGPNFTLRPLGPDLTLVALLAGLTVLAIDSIAARQSVFAINTVTAVFAIFSVELAARSRPAQLIGDVQGRACGLLVLLDDVNEQRKAVAGGSTANQNLLDADAERPRAQGPLVFKAHHDLRVDGSLGGSHRRRVEDAKLPGSSIHGLERLAPAPPHLTVAPHQVDVRISQIDACAVALDV